MKIIYKNFTIEEDVSCFILSEMWIKEKWENIWDEYIKEQVYPSTFEKAIEWIIKRLKANNKEIVELRNYVKEYKKHNDQLLKEINLIKNDTTRES